MCVIIMRFGRDFVWALCVECVVCCVSVRTRLSLVDIVELHLSFLWTWLVQREMCNIYNIDNICFVILCLESVPMVEVVASTCVTRHVFTVSERSGTTVYRNSNI